MIIYKLTRQNRTTRDGFKYPPKGKRLPELSGKGGLCSSGFYHGYAHPLLSVLHAPIHVDVDYIKMIEIEVPEVYAPNQMKLGFTTGTVGKVIPLPKITLEQKIRYGIGCACFVHKEKPFRKWADNWISGKDRSKRAARAIVRVVRAVWVAEAAETDWVDWAAQAAWTTAKVACEADWSAEDAAWAVARAATFATVARKDLDLIRIAEWAMTDEPLSELLGEE